MVEAVLELVVAPALVGAATLAAGRWGERVGGVVSAFPAIVGPVLLIAALEHGTAFAGRAASGTLLGLVALSGFAVAYAHVAPHAGWRLSLAVGWAAASALSLAVGALAPGPPAGLCAATVSLWAAHRALRTPSANASVPCAGTGASERAPGCASTSAATAATGATGAEPSLSATRRRPAVPSWDLPLRMALTALLVVALTAAASALGAVVGGMLAALPVLASVLAAFTHARYGARPVAALLRGMLAGMAGFVVFCALVAILAEPAGIAAAFTMATAAALAV
jgi:hypothetical protein